MKIKVEVDIQEILNEMFENFDPHEDYFELDLKESIKDGIIGDVKRQIVQMHNKEMKDKIANECKSLINLEMSDMIKKEVQDFSENGKLKERYGNLEPMSVSDWIKHHFSEKTNDYTRSIKDEINKRAVSCVKEIKSRYDLLFASQVITKMNNQDMLKEGVFKSLMNDKTS